MAKATVTSARTLRILLIEDQSVDQILIRRSLDAADLDAEVVSVRSASAALRALMTQPEPHLMMLDLELPGTHGIEFLGALKQDEKWRAIPVVVLSGTLDESSTKRAYALGAAAVIEKPRSVYELQDVVRRVAMVWGHAAHWS